MKTQLLLNRTLLSAAISALGIPAVGFANPLNIAQYPAGSANRTPIPNVVVTVDNSGSMGAPGIQALKQALTETFDPANIPDGVIRLAYQTMWGCNTIPSSDASCAKSGVSWNTMRELKGGMDTNEDSQRGQFFRWINTLGAGGNTPTHFMMWNAGEYLKTTGINSPWNEEPGKADSKPLACRRAYHILMTDGGWNQYPHTSQPGFMSSVNITNADGTAKTLPDNTAYATTSPQTTIYRDNWGSGTAPIKIGGVWTYPPFPTISDMAFHYWSMDLQPTINNEVVPLIRKSGAEDFTGATKTVNIQEYWNPKNNPATWQNMSTYTIGYNSAANWPNITTNPIFKAAQGMYGGDFASAITGDKVWRDPIATDENGRQEELWHAAINSRGKFYPAKKPEDLKNAFLDILGGIVADNTKPVTSFASSGTNTTRRELRQFVAGYDADGWKGYVYSDTLAPKTGAESPNVAWGVKTGQSAPQDRRNTADKLDALGSVASRLILTTNDVTNAGVSFAWASDNSKLSANQKAVLDFDAQGEDRLNFLRGDRTKEGNISGKPFRARKSRQGDIVNSGVWFVGQPSSNYSLPGYLAFAKANLVRNPMIYVGGNAGMLHGFSADDGEEKLAYVPKGLIPKLPQLSSPSYSHSYYVDGSPFTGDVNWGSSPTNDWRTLLVGTLGAGGRGYYLLDVTRPGTSDASIASNFFDSSAAEVVVLDKTLHHSDPLVADVNKPEADIGHIFAPPVMDDGNPTKATQVALMNNGKWAVVLGNGYNSTNERPVLLIQFVDKATNDMSLLRIPAVAIGSTEADQNGLSGPRLVDINGDGRPDVAYAGDLRGNLWKFDLLSDNPSQWGVAFGGLPMYTATYVKQGSTSRQPITVSPTVKANDRGAGGLMVAFGTGRNVTEGDRTDTTSKQTIYSLLDNTVYKKDSGNRVKLDPLVTPVTLGSGVSQLVEQTMNATSITGQGVSQGRTFWKMSSNDVNYKTTGTNPNRKGWFFNLPEPGERLLKTSSFYDASNLLEVMSQIPASGGNSVEELCIPSPQLERQFRTFLNIMDGKAPSVQIMDANGDGLFNKATDESSRMTTSIGTASNKEGKDSITVMDNGQPKVIHRDIITSTGSDGKKDIFARMPEQPLHPSWRQLQ